MISSSGKLKKKTESYLFLVTEGTEVTDSGISNAACKQNESNFTPDISWDSSRTPSIFHGLVPGHPQAPLARSCIGCTFTNETAVCKERCTFERLNSCL